MAAGSKIQQNAQNKKAIQNQRLMQNPYYTGGVGGGGYPGWQNIFSAFADKSDISKKNESTTPLSSQKLKPLEISQTGKLQYTGSSNDYYDDWHDDWYDYY